MLYGVLQRRAWTTTYISHPSVLFEIRLQGCKVDGVDAAGQAHGDDVIRGEEMVDDINSRRLMRLADKRHTRFAGRWQPVSAIAACTRKRAGCMRISGPVRQVD
jgi:hypothetical protein